MTQRLDAAFARAAAEERAALVTFVTGGDPSVAGTADVLDALVAGGVDVIEMGMPFTDPMADGPAIQAANLRALGGHVRTRDLLAIAAAFRQRHPAVPLVLMGYFNPILAYGVDRFAADAAAAGVDGVICVDVPPEEDAELGPALRAAGIDFIRLATPTTDSKRLPAVLDGAGGFLYYVSVAGITGQQQASQASIETMVARLKAATDLPVAVGFGIRTPEQAAAVGRIADGVIVGSAIVDLIGRAAAAKANDLPEQVTALVRSLADALASARRSNAA